MFCKRCGEELKEDSVFCPSCGSRVTEVLTGRIPRTEVISNMPKPEGDPYFVKRTGLGYSGATHEGIRYVKGSSTNWAPICLGIIIISIIIFAIIVISLLFVGLPSLYTQYSEPRLLGINYHRISLETVNMSELNLEMSLNVGQFTVEVSNSSSNYLYIEQEVWTSKENCACDIDQVAAFHESIGDITNVTFSADEGHNDYFYNLKIYIRPEMKLGLDLYTNAGQIHFNCIEEIILTNLELQSDAGSIDVDFRDIAYFEVDFATIQTLAGSISFYSNNINLTQGFQLNMFTDAGSIEIDMTQTIDFNDTLFVYTKTLAGSIDTYVNYRNTIGVSLYANAGLGSVDILGLTDGETDNYFLTTSHIDFYLLTDAGSIDFIASEM